VPEHSCVSQMFLVCTTAPESGMKEMNFGWGDYMCQTFVTGTA